MKTHYHVHFESLLVYAAATALIFHGFRFVGAYMSKQDGAIGKLGSAIGGAFTFGGQ